MFGNQDSLKSLRKFDLNLLTVFEAVYFYKSVSKAAELLGMTSPAVSQSIQRLRQFFPDPLFIRDGKGISPTVFADSMHDNIKISMKNIIDLFNDNGNSQRNLVIWSEVHIGQLLLPMICHHLDNTMKTNYGILHHILPENTIEIENALLYYKTDIIFDITPIYNSAIESKKIYHEKLVPVCRRDHPRLNNKLTAEDMHYEDYISIVDDNKKVVEHRSKLEAILGNRTYSFASSSLITALSVVSKSDNIGFFPASMFEQYKEIYQLKQLDYDLELVEYDIYMLYSKKSMQDKVLSSLIEKVQESLKEFH